MDEDINKNILLYNLNSKLATKNERHSIFNEEIWGFFILHILITFASPKINDFKQAIYYLY